MKNHFYLHLGNETIGDSEGEELLTALSFNVQLLQCNLNRTSISNQVQEKINNKLKENYPLTQTIGKTSLTKFCFKHLETSELIILNKIPEVKTILDKTTDNLQTIQEILFICCVWNRIELFDYIFNHFIIDINFKLEVSLFFSF